jgi:hemerythrin-like metal-binding protein
MIIWTEAFSVGVRKLDHQHQQLFKLVNELLENHDSPATSEPIADILERMTKYADYHFRTEERIMMEYGYPDYPLQVREHTEFKMKTAGFCLDAIAGKAGLSVAMGEYLQDWITSHILKSDLQFKKFLIDNGFLPAFTD